MVKQTEIVLPETINYVEVNNKYQTELLVLNSNT